MELPATFEGLVSSGVTYTSCCRTTQSDVMCTTNTTRRSDGVKPSVKNAELRRIQCVLPYDETMGAFSNVVRARRRRAARRARENRERAPRERRPPRSRARLPPSPPRARLSQAEPNPETMTLLQTSLGHVTKARTSEMMQEEQRRFMERLRQERLERTAAESDAVTRIQCAYRGFKTRPYPESVVSIRNARSLRKAKAHSHESLVRELHAFAKQAGLPPIEGSTLVPAKKITKKDRLMMLRAQQEQELASTKLQGLFRVRTAKHETAERRELKEQQELEKGAFLIQRVFRGLGAKNKTTRMKEEQAAIWIQNRYRQMISRTKMADVRHNIQQHHREDVAATTLQNIARRRCERGLLALPLSAFCSSAERSFAPARVAGMCNGALRTRPAWQLRASCVKFRSLLVNIRPRL